MKENGKSLPLKTLLRLNNLLLDVYIEILQRIVFFRFFCRIFARIKSAKKLQLVSFFAENGMEMNLFIGRENELKKLQELERKGTASLVVIRGRRRIGKSRLVEEFAKNKTFLQLAGIPPTEGITAQDQRDIFAQQLEKYTGIKGISSDDWASLFSLIEKFVNNQPTIILFDEISWMGSKDPTFLGKLKNAWDLEFKRNPNLIFILCGSVSSWIHKNILSSTAFFGRVSLSIHLQPLPLNHCYSYLRKKGFKGSVYEAAILLGILGGIPWYLEQVQPTLDAEENIKNMCFKKEGVLVDEFDRIFHDLFEKRTKIYYPIIEALAKKPCDFNELSQILGYAKSGTLTCYLEDLMEAGFLTRSYTWSIKSGKPSSLSQFRLSDNYLRFYLKVIAPNKHKIFRDGFEEVDILSLRGWTSILGSQFENLVLNNRKVIWKALGIKPINIVADNPYFQRQTKIKKGCQIDYLIQTRFNTLFAVEVKFSTHPIGKEVMHEMQQKLDALKLPKSFSVWPVLVHINGVSDQLLDSNYFAEIIDFATLLQSD